jgi:Tol biopolymer transport system component
MPLEAGTKLGPYEILAPLGAGGMGEVYRALDTKLEREVAIKVLPPLLEHNRDRLARFEREAKVLAALNHPNIAVIYGLEESSGTRAIAMELVPGETLGAKIKPAPLPLEEVLRIAGQIAEALEAAHDKGITHRDLKPANVMVTPVGSVKVLDFGLATIARPFDRESYDPSNSPTLTMGATEAGAIMGTAGYMSPEQAAGQPVDKRADIWSFGVVLWEMLTGHKLFGGETVSHTLADVLRAPIDYEKLPAETPSAIRGLLRRCLDRNVRTRLRDIGEARVVLGAPMGGAEAPPQAESLPHTEPKQTRWAWAVAAALAVGLAVAAIGWWRATRPVDQPLVRLDVDLGPDLALPIPDLAGSGVILSPDGTRLVYVASVAGGSRPKLFIRKLDQPKATELPGTDGAAGPFFSPDGQWVGFSTGAPGKLAKISVEGGAVVPLNETGGAASWGEDGAIVFGGFPKGLLRIPPGGGAPTPVTEPANEFVHWAPQILPGGKAVLFLVFGATPDVDTATIEAVTLGDHRRKVLARGGVSPHYLPTSGGAGHLVYNNKGTLFAVPFDPDKLETHGTAVPVLDDVAFDPIAGLGQFAFSSTPSGHGSLVYRRGSGAGAASGMSTLQWRDPDAPIAPPSRDSNGAANKNTLSPKPGLYTVIRFSPDGKRLAVEVREGGDQDIWVYEWQRDTWTKLTFGKGFYIEPVWSPDGRYIVFGSFSSGMFWTRADGAGQPQPLIHSKSIQGPLSFTPDGKRLAYFEDDPSSQIWTVPIEDTGGQWKAGTPERFLTTKFADVDPMFSPDGHWLAYMSNESGKNEVYVRTFPQPASGQGGKWVISTTGGQNPVWSRNGRELLYQAGDQIMSVSYTTKGDSFVPDKPRVWLAKLGGTQWDLAPDGKRIAVVTPMSTPETPKADHEVVFLQNFFDELRRRAPLR